MTIAKMSGRSQRPPSLLIVLADQMRWRDVGCADGRAKTPTLDALGDQGVVLTNCYANTPVCTPSRACFLTGSHAMSHRAVANDLPLDEGRMTFGEVAEGAGYQTAYVGKWHLDGVPRSKFTPPGPRRHGFQYWAVHNCTHQYFRPRYYRDDPTMIEADGYEPTVQTDLMLSFLRGLGTDQPFLGVLSWGPPHDPYDQVPERYRKLYGPDDVKPLPNVDLERLARNPQLGNRELTAMTRDYYAAYSALDAEVGRLLEELDDLGRADDTIVCFSSDHGDMLGAHGLLNKQTPYEESIHVPLIMRWPQGLPAGVRDDQLISMVDLGPTLLGLLGTGSPPEMEGEDRSRSLGRGLPGATSVLLANLTCFDQAVPQGIPEWRGVRTARYTYVERVGREPWLLFDNERDLWQLENLVTAESRRETRAELAMLLGRWLEQTADPFESTEKMIDRVAMRAAWDRRQAGYD